MSFNKITILGGGNLGGAIATGLLKAKYTSPDNIIITRRRSHLLADFEEKGIGLMSDNVAAIKDAEIVVLAVKPHQVQDLLTEIATGIIASKPIVVSVITGVSSAEIIEKLPGVAVVPGRVVHRTTSPGRCGPGGRTSEGEAGSSTGDRPVPAPPCRWGPRGSVRTRGSRR